MESELILPLSVSGIMRRLASTGEGAVVRRIVGEFCPRFISGGKFAYVRDLRRRVVYSDKNLLQSFGVSATDRKMPAVIVKSTSKNWLFLIEALSKRGGINQRRLLELDSRFAASGLPLVFVTAALERDALSPHFADIAWGTHVWAADEPRHLIHLDKGGLFAPVVKFPQRLKPQ